MKRRAYQIEALKALRTLRSFFLLWRRQGGKSTTLAAAALDEMMGTPGRLVTYASASLLLGREIVLKEAQVLQGAIAEFMAIAQGANLKLETVRAGTGTRLEASEPAGCEPHGPHACATFNADDFAELFESQRLEFRLWHDRTTHSRTQVIAPNPATARGWSGTVMLDEFGFIRDFRDLWEAVEPIISSDRSFKFVGATTPPKDDAHYSYELTAPPIGTEFEIKAEGNWYESEAGERIHRVDIHDAHAAGQKLYDRRTGQEVSPQEHFARAEDKDAWRRNYAVQHVLGGTSAVGLLVLETAQRRGAGSARLEASEPAGRMPALRQECAFFQVDSSAGGANDLDFDRALKWLGERLGEGELGMGIDLATTTKESSNPTAVCVMERRGIDLMARAMFVWKTADPAVAAERIERIAHACRAEGRTLRRMAVDATNERYFAAQLKRELAGICPVELVVGSEKVERPGAEPMNMKQWLGGRLVAELEDNHVWLPPERYVREDFRLVKRDRGQFVCEPDAQGRHGDTFDAAKLALHALVSTGDAFTGETARQVKWDGNAVLRGERERWRVPAGEWRI